MAIQADDFVKQFGAETVHHAHHHDQRSDAEHDRDQTDTGNEEDKPLPLARQQIAFCDDPFVTG